MSPTFKELKDELSKPPNRRASNPPLIGAKAHQKRRRQENVVKKVNI
jgi:hypothetical protein